jgi:hypothetical protein
MMELFDRVAAPPAVLTALRRELARLHNLGDVLTWARNLVPPVTAPTVVTQDEYTHDVVVAWRDGLTLAFDVT